MTARAKKLRAVACGFREIGFKSESTVIETDRFHCDVIGAAETDKRLDDFNAAIVPSGAFEKIEKREGYSGYYYKVIHNPTLIADRRKQLNNVLSRGGWICLLIDVIRDRLPDGNYGYDDIEDTDLCKQVLNGFGIRREAVNHWTGIKCHTDEFRGFSDKYGTGNTALEIRSDLKEVVRLMTARQKVFGAVIWNQIFLFPFSSSSRSSRTLEDVIQSIIDGVLDYRQKNSLILPEWLSELRFKEEARLGTLRAEYENKLALIEGEERTLQQFKGILTSSNRLLVELVQKIFEEYFGLLVNSEDKGKEDMRILADDGDTRVLFEVKGVKGGFKRKYLGQIDDARQDQGFDERVPAVLLVNDEMSLDGIEAKKGTTIPQDQIRHGVDRNIVLMRTIDLLCLMLSVEEKSVSERRELLLGHISKGGGWLKSENGGLILKRE